MKHLLLQFAEIPKLPEVDLSVVEYNSELSLTVLKGTNIPAVAYDQQATKTFTKIQSEASDADRDERHQLEAMLGTSTQTREYQETSDSDPHRTLLSLIGTSTQTF